MTRLLTYLVLLPGLGLLAVACGNNLPNREKEAWVEHLTNRQTPEMWDMLMLESDLRRHSEHGSPGDPMSQGVFPEPRYDLYGGESSFTGLGNVGIFGGDEAKTLKGKAVLYNSFYVKRNSLNSHRLGDRADEVFFHIVVLTDYVDTLGYSHVGSRVVSRNHPDYIGEGFLDRKSVV